MAFKITRHLRFLLATLLLLLVVGCSANPQSPVLAFFFDLPPPGEAGSNEMPPRRPRHMALPAPPPLLISKEYIAMVEALIKAGAPPNWPDIFKKLPKDDEDNIDWMAALKDKLITPASDIDPDAAKPAAEPLDLDVEISTSGKPDRMVVFPHKSHTQWLVCDNCHPAIFEQEAGSAKITMAAIDGGKYCGVCHDKVAMALPSGCNGCHKPIKKS